MTYFDTDDLRDSIAEQFDREEEILIESSDVGKAYYELFYVPAKEQYLMIYYANDGQRGGVYSGFADLREHLDEIDDELLIEFYNEHAEI